MFWNNSINLSLSLYYVGHIDCLISMQDFVRRFTRFYGNPNMSLQKFSWTLLRKLFSLSSPATPAWLVGGDFNEILYSSEKKGVI